MRYLSPAEANKIRNEMDGSYQIIRRISEEGSPQEIKKHLARVFGLIEKVSPKLEEAARRVRNNPGDEKSKKELGKFELQFNIYREWETMLEDALTKISRQTKEINDARVSLLGSETFESLQNAYLELMKNPAGGTKEWREMAADILEYVGAIEFKSRGINKMRRIIKLPDARGTEELEDIVADVFDEIYDYLFI